MKSSTGDITQLLNKLADGDQQAAAELVFPLCITSFAD
jgi:hypothetical protein